MRKSNFRGSTALLLAALALASVGCAIGPMEHQGRPPGPGEDLLTDLARATRGVTSQVREVAHNEPLPPNEVPPEPVPPAAPVTTPLADSPCYNDQAGVPLLEPLPGPPPRFFPVPTRPVFSSSHCDAWTTEF